MIECFDMRRRGNMLIYSVKEEPENAPNRHFKGREDSACNMHGLCGCCIGLCTIALPRFSLGSRAFVDGLNNHF